MIIREFSESMEPEVIFDDDYGRWVIVAYNEGGCNLTKVDLLDVIDWVKENKPELLG